MRAESYVKLALILFVVVILATKLYAVLISSLPFFKNRKVVGEINKGAEFFVATHKRIIVAMWAVLGIAVEPTQQTDADVAGSLPFAATALLLAGSALVPTIDDDGNAAPVHQSRRNVEVRDTESKLVVYAQNMSAGLNATQINTTSSTSTTTLNSTTTSLNTTVPTTSTFTTTSTSSTSVSSTLSPPTTAASTTSTVNASISSTVSSSVSTSVSTSSSTSSTITSTSTINSTSTSTVMPTVIANITKMKFSNGALRATVAARSGRANISVGGAVLGSLNVRFRNSNASMKFNISVTNSLQLSGIPQPRGQVYRYILINESVYNSTNSVDPYIGNVTYNFRVNDSWIAAHGAAGQNVTLMKYVGGNWTSLPTSFIGSDQSYYYYSAVSNSFSTYAVSYVTDNTVGTGAVTASMPSGLDLYFYAGSTNSSKGNTQPTVSWTQTSKAQYTSGSGSSKLFRNATVGYSTSNAGTFTGTSLSNNIVVGIGANVVLANGAIFSANTGTTATGTSNVLTFKTVTANSFVIIASAISNHTLSSFKTTAPGNVVLQSQNGKAEWAGIMVINSLAVGTYTVTTTASAKGAIAQSAFVFPSYSVTFNDVPSTAYIATNGINQASGNTVARLIGMGTINAIAPAATNSVFSSWSVDNSINATVTDPLSQNSFLVVGGNAVVTANFNAITTFTETGLPAGTAWNVIYNGITVSNSPPPDDDNVIFNTTWWGGASFTVPAQGSYTATPASGSFGAGGTQIVSFSASAPSCFISLDATSVGFGTIAPGSSVFTINAITDTNVGGTAQSSLLIAGGLGSSSPYNGIWIGTSVSNQIGISNTVWNPSSLGSYGGNAITNSFVDTTLIVPAGGSNTIYLGMGIPGGTPVDTYTTNIVLEATC